MKVSGRKINAFDWDLNILDIKLCLYSKKLKKILDENLKVLIEFPIQTFCEYMGQRKVLSIFKG